MIYVLIFVVFAFLAILIDEKPSKPVLWSLTGFFMLFVGLRSPYIDNDYQMYLEAIKDGWGVAEISFFWIADISLALTKSTIPVFLTYAIICMVSQITVIYKHSSCFWLSMAFFLATYFILLDMNAMRGGAALGIAMHAWAPWSKNEHLKAIGILLLGCFFHYSIFLLLIAYPFVRNDKKLLKWFLLLIPVAYAFHYFVDLKAIFQALGSLYVSTKTKLYNLQETGELSVVSTVMLIRIAIIAVLWWYRETFEKKCDMFYLFFKLYIIGFFLCIVIADLPAMAMRTLDLFVCGELILLPLFREVINPKWVATTLVVLYGAFYLYLYVFIGEYVRGYSLNL